MSAHPPGTLGKYQILREIARSNDIVYEGYDPLMNRRVALKELNVASNLSAAQREERVRRFEREVKAAGSLSHPNIVTIFEFGEHDGRYFMAMEYLDGRTLRNELDTNGLIAPDRALEIAIEILEGLEFAHRNGVIHRDIKPENIQILSDGRIKLTDFGIARLTFEPNITMDGQVFGTPSYMSPEQVVGKEIDARSDLFSVGSVLYEMLTGQKAFAGDSVVSISYAIMNSEPAPPAAGGPLVADLLRGLLQKSAALRFPSASEALSAFRQAVQSMKQGHIVAPPAYGYGGASGVSGAYPPGALTPYGTPGAPQNYPPSYPPSYPSGQATGLPSGAPYPPPPIQQTGAHYPGTQAPPYQYPGYQPPPASQYPPQIPVYIGPPPRPPLFKPETRAFMGKLFAILVSCGIVFGLVVVGIQSMATALDQMRVSDGAGGTRAAGAPGDSARLNPEALAEAERILRSGEQQQRLGQFDLAESQYRQVIELAPSVAAPYRRLAELLVIRGDTAARAGQFELARQHYEEAGDRATQAAERETQPDQAYRDRDYAARCHFNAGVMATRLNNRSEALRLFLKAREQAHPNTDVARQIRTEIDAIS